MPVKKDVFRQLDAVVKEFGAPKESVTVTIMEAPRELKMKAGVLFSER